MDANQLPSIGSDATPGVPCGQLAVGRLVPNSDGTPVTVINNEAAVSTSTRPLSGDVSRSSDQGDVADEERSFEMVEVGGPSSPSTASTVSLTSPIGAQLHEGTQATYSCYIPAERLTV